jgi:hypothetical protein
MPNFHQHPNFIEYMHVQQHRTHTCPTNIEHMSDDDYPTNDINQGWTSEDDDGTNDDDGTKGINRGWTRLDKKLHTHGKKVIASQQETMEGLKKMLVMHKAVLATDQEVSDKKMHDDCVDIIEKLIKVTWEGTNESYALLNKSVNGLDQIGKVLDNFGATMQVELQTTVKELSVGLCKTTGALEGERGFDQDDDDSYNGPYGDAKFAQENSSSDGDESDLEQENLATVRHIEPANRHPPY